MIVQTLIIAALLVAPGVAHGQQSGEESAEVTIETLYLSSSLGVPVMRAQLETGSRDQQVAALAALQNQIREGGVDPTDPEVFAMVRFALDQGVHVRARLNGSLDLTDYRPLVRIEAARTLGMLGTAEAHDYLLGAILNDPEPSVRGQAAYALATLGLDDGGAAVTAITEMIFREHTIGRDVGAIYDGLSALSTFELDPYGDAETRTIAVQVAQDFAYPRVLREKAIEVLAGM